jgi:hypothetical protein
MRSLNSEKGKRGWQRRLTDKQELALINDYISRDLTRVELAEKYEVGYSTIQKILKRNGYRGVKRPHMSDELKEQAIKYYLDGNSALKTACEFGFDQATIVSALKAAGIKRRSPYSR